MALRLEHTTDGRLCSLKWVHDASDQLVISVAMVPSDCPECLLAKAAAFIRWVYGAADGGADCSDYKLLDKLADLGIAEWSDEVEGLVLRPEWVEVRR